MQIIFNKNLLLIGLVFVVSFSVFFPNNLVRADDINCGDSYFGYCSGATDYNLSAGYLYWNNADTFTAPITGIVNELAANAKYYSQNGYFQLGLYNSSGNVICRSTDTLTVTSADASYTWKTTSNFDATCSVTEGQTYKIAVLNRYNVSVYIAATALASGLSTNNLGWAGGLPASLTQTAASNYKLNLRAHVIASFSSPSVDTTVAGSTTDRTTLSGGNVTSDGGATVTARGVCYGASPNPTTPCTSDGSGTGIFTSSLSGLDPSTLYYYRAFATNSIGTSYGSNLNFTTSADVTSPTRSAGSPSSALDPGTTSAALSLTTTENATCKYSTTAGIAYGSMTNEFLTTGGTSQSTTISGLSDGGSYNYYVRCQDSYNNPNTDDYQINFSVNTAAAATNDYYSWETRTDRHGKPAGIFTSTPFPIDENTTSYVIRNDENASGKTFIIDNSKIVFVDGNLGANCTGNYLPTTRACGGGLHNAYTTIAAGIAATSDGNWTVLVRDGNYTETLLIPKNGTDDTHRWMMVGYSQERPVINGVSTINNSIIGNGKSYFTIQRLKIQDNYQNGIRTNALSSYVNVIDVELYNNDKWDEVNSKTWADGNLYFLGSSDNWIFHSTAGRSGGHGFKVGDGGDRNIVEWSIAYESAWWTGNTQTDGSLVGASCKSTNFDFPNDAGVIADDIIARYNIGYTSMGYGMQIRNLHNFSIHHNEIYDSPHWADRTGCQGGNSPGQVIIFGQGANNYSDGNFYSNVIHDPGSAETGFPGAITVYSNQATIAHTMNIYNNLVYDTDTSVNPARGLYIQQVDTGSTNMTFNVYNNTFYFSSADTTGMRIPLIVFCDHDNCLGAGTGSSANVKNNIIYKAGVAHDGIARYGSTVAHTNNLYYRPDASVTLGESRSLDATEIDNSDPLFTSVPSEAFIYGMGNISSNSPAKDVGKNLATIFTTDFNLISRPQSTTWDIGMFEFINSDITAPMITAFTIPSTSDSLTVSISSFTATDTVGVTGYKLTETSTAPLAGDSGWTASAPTTYVFSSDGTKTLYAWAKDAAGNISTSLNDTITVDSTAPVRSAGSPSGSQSAGTTQATLSLTTNESATCKYGTTASTAYASIANTFSTTGGTSHSSTISGLSNGTSYNYYVRCTDGSNINTSDYTISFSVASSTNTSGSSIQNQIQNLIDMGNIEAAEVLRKRFISQEQINLFRTLKKGDRGPDVTSLQNFLNTKLNLNLIIDGILGLNTVNAIKKWQKQNNLIPDGIVGPNTRATMTTMSDNNPEQNPATSHGVDLGNTILKKGSTGEVVKNLQIFLNTQLNLNLITDGILGPNTTDAIKKWQEAHGLIPDGIVGPKTREGMNSL